MRHVSINERLQKVYDYKSSISAVKKASIKNRLFLYAPNEESLHLKSQLEKNGYPIDGIVVSSTESYDDYWMGLRVTSCAEYLSEYSGYSLLLISYKLENDAAVMKICSFLNAANFDYYFYGSSSVLKLYSALDYLNGVRKGCVVYKHLKIRHKDAIFLVCPYPGTGDAYLTGMHLKQYIDSNVHSKYKIIVPGKAFFKILCLFGIEESHIDVISIRDMNNLKNLIGFAGSTSLGIHYLMYWGLPLQTACLFEGFKGLSFPELFKTCVFGFSDDVLPAKMAQRIASREAIAILKNEGLAPGNTVVIAPYANSFVEELDSKWWEDLVLLLQKRGFVVATNCNGTTELPIGDTKSVSFPYDSIIPLMDACGYFIGIRSGLCDVISSSSCKKIIIYQNFITKRRMEFFSLFHLNKNQELLEYKYESARGGKEHLIHEILNGGYFDR